MTQSNKFGGLEDFDFGIYDGLFERIEDALALHGNECAICSAAELDGFFMSIGCSPELVLPSVWLPAIWGGAEHNPIWEQDQQASEFVDSVFIMYELTLDQLKHGVCPLFITNPHMEEGIEPVIQEWCKGFIRGIELWMVQSKRLANIDELLAPIRLFAKPLAGEVLENMTPADMIRWAERIEPNVLCIRDAFNAPRMEYMLAPFTPYPSGSSLTARNQPCPCGSGKNFGKCCLH